MPLRTPKRNSLSSSARSQNKKKQRTVIPETDDLFSFDDSHCDNENESESNIILDDSFFGQTVSKAGLTLYKGDTANSLKCDQGSFQRSISKSLALAPSTLDDAATDFLVGLEDHLKLPQRLKWSLLYTNTDPECEVASRGQQDSLIRLLLNIDALQPKLVTLLTDTLLMLAYQQTETSDSSNLPALLLSNLRWLEHVVQPEALTDAVLMVLSAATAEVQIEMIQFIPNIITDEFHPRAADTLRELYDSNPSLCPAILDTLLDLTLSDESVKDMHATVLGSLQAALPPHLPCILKFLLHNTSSSEAYEVLGSVRSKLLLPSESSPGEGMGRSLISSQHSSAVTQNLTVLICSSIKTALLLKKYLTNIWLKVIDEAEGMLPIDLFLLMIVHDALPVRRRPVYSILRNKIRAGLQHDTLLQETLTDSPAVMREYFDSLKKIAGIMLRSVEPAVSHFGSTLYRVMFESSSVDAASKPSSSRGYNTSLQQGTVIALLAHLGDDQHARLAALSLLANLSHSHTTAMAKFAIFLKNSLERLERLTLQESRFLLDAVSAVAVLDRNTALYNELAIFTRKMINNNIIRYKQLGVLSAVLRLKNSANDDEDSSEESEIGGSEEELEMVRTCTANCPPAAALFMDELASTILRDGINTTLERWLSERLEQTFEGVFTQDLEENNSADITTEHTQLCMRLSFNAEPDQEAIIAMNIGPLVDKLEQHQQLTHCNKAPHSSSQDNSSVILTLCPHFRLLRMLVSHLNEGELSAIDGLLGCPVYYPAEQYLNCETFKTLRPDQKAVILSSLFFAANWFRELINAFATQKLPEIKKKIFIRLHHLLDIEKSLSSLLPYFGSYVPHVAVTHIDASSLQPPTPSTVSQKQGPKQKKANKKKKAKNSSPTKAGTTLGPSQISQLPSTSTAHPSSQLPATSTAAASSDSDQRFADLSLYKPYLRELHLDVFSLLFKSMSLDIDLPDSGSQLTIPGVEFLLTDLNLKLSHVFSVVKRSSALSGKTSAEKDVGFWHLELFSAEEIATQAQRYVKPLCVHLDKISSFFKCLIEDHDGILDCSGVLNKRTLPIVKVQGLLLTSLQLLLGWPALYRHSMLYTGMLRTVCRKLWHDRPLEEIQALPLDELLWGGFQYSREQLDTVLELGSAVLVIRLLESIVSLARLLRHEKIPEREATGGAHSNTYGYKLGEAISTVLQRTWISPADSSTLDKGTLYNARIAVLLHCWLKYNPRPLTVIEGITSSGIEEYISGNNCSSETFPTLNKNTLVVFFNCLLSNLAPSVKKALNDASSSADEDVTLSSQEEESNSLAVWNTAVEVYSKLFHVVKFHHSRHLLSACLKHARPFIELFLNFGMKLLDGCLTSRTDEVVKLLKTLQSATRTLQIVCTESKVKMDVSLTSYVPLTRRSLATLMFRVKAMLARHNNPQACWLGVLKNRNLEGEIISTQANDEDADVTTEQKARPSKDRSVSEQEKQNDATDSEDSSSEGDGLEGGEEGSDKSDVELDEEEDESRSISKRGRGSQGKRRRSNSQDSDEEESEESDMATHYSESF